MGDLFSMLARRMGANARRAVEVYARDMPEFRAMADGDNAALLDFAVLLRRRTVELAADDRPFTDDDLSTIAAAGHAHARAGVSFGSHRRALGLHSTLTVQEIHEVAGPRDADALLRMLGWFGPQGVAGQDAYSRGFLDGQGHVLPDAERVPQLATALLAGDPAGPGLAGRLGMPVPAGYLLTVVRIADPEFRPTPAVRSEVLGVLIDKDRVPMTWNEPLELVVLVPAEEPDQQRALSLVAAFAETVGRPCAAGATTASPSGLPGALPWRGGSAGPPPPSGSRAGSAPSPRCSSSSAPPGCPRSTAGCAGWPSGSRRDRTWWPRWTPTTVTT